MLNTPYFEFQKNELITQVFVKKKTSGVDMGGEGGSGGYIPTPNDAFANL